MYKDNGFRKDFSTPEQALIKKIYPFAYIWAMDKVPDKIMKQAIHIFIAYSRDDSELLEQLRKQLRVLERTKNVKVWCDKEIEAGQDWEKSIKDALYNADIILLLISASFIASDYAYEKEMKDALQLHEQGKARAIPIILRECLWEDTPFANLQALPLDPEQDNKLIPATSHTWRTTDRPYLQIAKSLKEIIADIRADRKRAKSQATEAAKIQAQRAEFQGQITKANQLFKNAQYSLAAQNYQRANTLWLTGFYPDKHQIEAQIKQCNIEIGFAEKLQTATTALEKADAKAALTAANAALKLKPNHAEAQQIKASAEQLRDQQRQALIDSVTQNRMLRYGMLGILTLLLLVLALPYLRELISEPTSSDKPALTRFQDDSGKWGAFNEQGDTIIEPIYENMGEFDGQYIAVEQNNLWGYMNAKGKISIPLTYQNVAFKGFENGQAWVKTDTADFYINPQGECVKDCPEDKTVIKEDKNEQQFQQLIAEADRLFVKEQYKDAQAKYSEAKKLKPNSPEAQNGIDKCKRAIEPSPEPPKKEPIAEKPKEKPTKTVAEIAQEKYDGLIQQAKTLYDTESYSSARSKYQQALTHKPNGSEAQTGIKKCDNKLNPPPPPPPKYDPEIQKLIDDMVDVIGGTFQMGCIKERDGDCESDEKEHTVTLDSYKIGRYEVTQAQWKAVMGSNPSHFSSCGDDCPVERVSWDDIQGFIKKLNSKTGKNFRLPTEAEWEYAARGGNKSKGYKYAGSDNIDAVAWYSSNSGSKTYPVGGKTANGLGLYDMSGNVWEWCSDWYDENYYASSPAKNPENKTAASRRVLRGGSWYSDSSICRVSSRFRVNPTGRGSVNGFRLAQN